MIVLRSYYSEEEHMHAMQIYKKAIFSFVVLYILLFSSLSWGAEKVSFVERPDDQFLILGLEINGFSRSEGIDAYMPTSAAPEEILIPLGLLAEALSVSIETDSTEGTAQGFFLDEKRIFELDLLRKQVISADKRLKLPDGIAEAHEDDIYVQIGAIGEWFGLKTNMDTGSLTLYITSDAVFPFQASQKRKDRAKKLLTKSRRTDFDEKEAYLLPYGQISAPSIVFQQSISGSKTASGNSVQSFSSIEGGFDLLGFGANLNLSYSADNDGQSEIANAGLTLSKSDPNQELLGKLKAGRVDLGDVNFTDVTLFGGAGRGAGVSISSEADFGFRLSQQLGTVTIDGDAPINWDVEIYRNGQFIDFQTVDASARFEFLDVTLISGFNRFQIVLFGPEGQKRTITRDIFSGPNMLADGVLRYDAAVGLPQSDLLQITENPRNDGTLGATGRLTYGVSNFLTLGGSFFTGPIDGEKTSAIGLTAATAYLGFNAQLQGSVTQNSESGFQAALSKKILGTNTTLTHTVFDGFDAIDQDVKDTTEISVGRSFGPISVNLQAEKTRFIDNQDDETTVEAIVGSQLFGTKFTNSLTKTISDNAQTDALDGELTFLNDLLGLRLRSSLSYDLDPSAEDVLQTYRLSTQKRFNATDTIRFGGNYNFPTDLLSIDTRISHEFGPVTLDFDLGYSSDDSYTAGINVRSSFVPVGHEYKIKPPRIGTLATLGVRAFVDENGNKVFDENETPLQDIIFKATRNEQSAKTAEDGIAWLYGLAETPTRIYVSEQDIGSIFLVPAQKGRDLIPRRGAKSVVDFPFTQLGEIDGFVENEIDGEPLGDVPLRLIDLATGDLVGEMESEYDGYFVFSALPLGSYKVIASQGWFEEGAEDTDAAEVALTGKKPSVLDVVLKVPPLLEPCPACTIFHEKNPGFVGPPRMIDIINIQQEAFRSADIANQVKEDEAANMIINQGADVIGASVGAVGDELQEAADEKMIEQQSIELP